MPSVNVVLKNGTVITVDGANDAAWTFETIAEPMASRSLLLVVQFRDAGGTKMRGKFRAEEIAGFAISLPQD
ncbi:MAG: hypothetical protein ACKVT1_17030 [Dehalococcoidia bacterium]